MWEGNLPAFGMREQFRQNKAADLLLHAHSRLVAGQRVPGTATRTTTIRSAGPIRGLDVVESLGLRGLAPGLPDISGLLKVSFPGSGLTGLSQIDWTNPGFLNRINQIQNQTTWLRGTHSFKFGAEVRHIDWEEQTAPANLFGNVDFTGRFTAVPGIAASGHPYADFLFGVPNTASRAFPPVPALRAAATYDFFAQDDWKLTRNLTLNLGLRYELHPGWTEREDRLAFFDIVSGKIVVPDGGVDNVSPLMPTAYVDVVSCRQPRIAVTTRSCAPTATISRRALDVAYRPFGGGETVIRGGYGLYYDMMPIDIWASRAPFVFQETAFTNPAVPSRGAADRVSRGRHGGTGNHRAATRGQSGSAASVQPSVERHDRARAVENRLPFVLCRHTGTRDVVHARRQRASS